MIIMIRMTETFASWYFDIFCHIGFSMWRLQPWCPVAIRGKTRLCLTDLTARIDRLGLSEWHLSSCLRHKDLLRARPPDVYTNIYQLIRLIGRLRTCHVPMQHPSWQSIRRSTEKLSMMTRLMLRWFAGNSIPGACFEAALDTECVTDIEVKTCKIAEEPVRKIWTPRRRDLTSTSENKSAFIIFYIVVGCCWYCIESVE